MNTQTSEHAENNRHRITMTLATQIDLANGLQKVVPSRSKILNCLKAEYARIFK